ncbi:DUF5324 family protein [Streptomyces sp. NPDC046324]|uniref:DUF5324 family protein n=1 Tax=Streptomyces sp. NPDC046324 TaxID=3154915 RepID=UPI0033D6727F
MASANWLGSIRRRIERAVRAAGPLTARPGDYCSSCGAHLPWEEHTATCDLVVSPEQLLRALLRRPVIAAEVERLVRPEPGPNRIRKLAKGLAFCLMIGGASYAAWRWWDRQNNPDWLVEPPRTEVSLDVGDENAEQDLREGDY